MADALTARELEELRLLIEHRITDNARPTGVEIERYRLLREAFMADPRIAPLLPAIVTTCRGLSDGWTYIKDEKEELTSWQSRRAFLRKEFAAAFEILEASATRPIDDVIAEALEKNFDTAHVSSRWASARQRLQSGDLRGALTASRSLVESACKHVLDALGKPYGNDEDLGALYTTALDAMGQRETNYEEPKLRGFVGAARKLVSTLGPLRTTYGDAHGEGTKAPQLEPRYVELAVNIAGSVAMFLAQSLAFKKPAAPGGGWDDDIPF